MSDIITIGYRFLIRKHPPNIPAPKAKADFHFKKFQLCSSALFSFSHGSNDARKTMGIIVPLLFSIGYFGASADPNNLPVPVWVILACYRAISLGTLSGEMRIVKRGTQCRLGCRETDPLGMGPYHSHQRGSRVPDLPADQPVHVMGRIGYRPRIISCLFAGITRRFF